MSDSVRRQLAVHAADGASSRLQLHLPAEPRAALYWIPALGVGIGPNERFADALAAEGVAVAVHEWRGLGGSDRRASRRCDWGYRELLELDIPAGLEAARAALPQLRWQLGGHSLGGQFALLEAARREPTASVLLVASGQPWWRAFPAARGFGVRLFAHAIAPLVAACGYFPGQRLGFAGREAATLMRQWAGSCLRGSYRIDGFGSQLDDALAGFAGRVLALRMAEDRLAPPGAIERLRQLAPRAAWQVQDFGREHFATRRPDHFGWLREPDSIVRSHAQWSSTRAA